MKQNRKEPRLMDLQWVRRALLLFLGDVVIIIMASVGALIARFDFSYSSIDAVYLDSMYHYLPIHIFTTVVIFYFCRMYHSLWKFISIHELGYIILANTISFFMQIIGYCLFQYLIPKSYFFCADYVTDSNGDRNTIFLPFLPIPERSEGTVLWLRRTSTESDDYRGGGRRACYY